MTARNRINLILAGLLLGLGALALWGPAPQDPDAPRPRAPLTPMTADQVQTVEIQRPGLDGAIRLQRDKTRWQVFLPGRDAPLPADDFKAQQLTELAEAQVYDRFPAPERLDDYRLDAPLATVRLNAAVLRFGGTEPVHHRRYVLYDGQVALIDDRHYDPVAAHPEAFVSRALFPESVRIEAIELPEFQIRRGEAGWQLTPEDPERSGDALQSFVDAWRQARALDVRLAEAPAPEAEERIRIRSEAGVRELHILQREPRLRLLDPERGLIYEFAAYTGERLLRLEPHQPPPAEDEGEDA